MHNHYIGGAFGCASRRSVSIPMRKYLGEGPITAKEIGRQLGLSQPTVSRVLSGATGHRVSPETRQRVLEAAAQMGYRPNALARSLRQGRTNIIGFYTGYGYLDARNPFLAELIGGLQRAADPRRQDILLHGIFRGASTDDIYGELVDGRIDGLFLHTHSGDPLVARLQNSSLPVVAIADAIAHIPSVIADDAGGTGVEDQATGIESLTNNSFNATVDYSADWAEAKAEIDANRPLKSGIPGHARACAGWKRQNIFIIGQSPRRWLRIYDPWPWNANICEGGAVVWEDWDAVTHTNFMYVRHA